MNEDGHAEAWIPSLRKWADELANSVPPFDIDTMPLEVAQPPNQGRRALVASVSMIIVGFGIAAWWSTLNVDDRVVVQRPPLSASTSLAAPNTNALRPVVASTPLRRSANGEGRAAGITLTLETPDQVLAGTRVPIKVEIVNTGLSTVYWEAGGCGALANVKLGPVGVTEPSSSSRLPATPSWDGTPAGLAGAIESMAVHLTAQLAQPASITGWDAAVCPAISRVVPIPPGETAIGSSTVDVRVAPGALPAGGRYEVIATFVGYATDDPRQPLAPIEARAPLTVVDDPARSTLSTAEVVELVLDDARLDAWLSRPGKGVAGTHYVTLSWWRDAWELWARPLGDLKSMRLRIDPGLRQVIDARLVHASYPPEDEPGAARNPGMIPDVILGPSESADEGSSRVSTSST